LIDLGVLQWVLIGSWCFPVRFNRLLQSSGEFSTGIEVFGEFSFGIGFLWNFSLFMFGLKHFLVFFYKSLYCVLQIVPA
jgi:hypothetical protein